MIPAAGVAGGAASSIGLCSIFTGLCSACSCAMSTCVSCFTGVRCCSGAACAGSGKDAWGAGKVGSLLVVIYSVVLSFIFQYGVGDKMAHFDKWTGPGGACGGAACLGQQGVFRVNVATVAFFVCNWVGCRMSKQYQDGLWILKVVCYAAFVTGALFLPFELVNGYVWVARVGASVFAVLQMVVIIDLAYQVNDYMVEASQASGGYGEGSAFTCGLDDSLATLVGFALLLFAAALAGIVCLFVFFSECATTTAFVAMTLVLCVAVCATQLALSESGNLLTSSAVCAYGVFVLYTAVSRDPHARCNPSLHDRGHDWPSVTIGLFLAFVSLVWTTQASSGAVGELLDGGDLGAELVPTKDGDDDEESAKSELGPAPMDCLDGGDRDGARFNLALALVSMYAACTLTNWGTWEAANGGKVAPLAGLVSMWLNIAAQWCLFLLYEWTLVAGLLFPDRDFS